MTVTTLAVIILSLFGVALFSGVLILIYYSGKWSVKDNPDKAILLVKTGSHTKAVNADLAVSSDKGKAFVYKNKTVCVPVEYTEIYHKCRRLLFIDYDGKLIASPFESDKRPTNTQKDDLIYSLVESKIGADAIRALKGKATMSIIIVALIAFVVGAIGVYGFIRFQDTMKQNKIAQQSQVKPSPTQIPQIVEVK